MITKSQWLENIRHMIGNCNLDRKAHSWELDYWFNVGYTASQIAYVVKNRPEDYTAKNPWWVKPE